MNTTIKPKIGICEDCQDGKEKPLTAKRCKHHYWKFRAELKGKKEPKKRTKINQFSAKQLERLKDYRKIRDEFMKAHNVCQARLAGCTIKATDLHHKKSRDGELLTDTKFFMAVCRSCHNKIEDGGEWVYDKGFKIKRLTN